MSNLIPVDAELRAIEILAKNACESKFFQKMGGYAGIFSIAMFARELGLPVMQCLFGGIRNIDGNVEISPRMMNMMIRKAGHQVNILKSDDKICILKGIRKDTGEIYECSYSMEDASKAGNANKHNYKSYANDMLFARCLSRLARRLFADVIGSSYVEGEIEQNETQIRTNGNEVRPNGNEESQIEIALEIMETLHQQQKDRIREAMERIDDGDFIARLNSYLEKIGKSNIFEIEQKHFDKIIKHIEDKANEKESINESSTVA